FNYTYLIDRINQSSHEVKFTNHEIIFNMVAENIFKDFTQSDFAGYKRGVRVNLDQYLVEHYAFGHRNEQGEVILDQRWIKRYSSFGMASITVPADRIEMACAYKVAADVVDHWGNLSGEGYKPAQLTETVLKDILPGIRIYEGTVQARGEDEMRHDLLNGLLDDGRKTGQRLHNLISEEVGVAAREARDGVYKDQGVTLANFLRIGIQNVAVKLRRDKHDPQQWGDYARAIHFNKETIVAEVQQLLRQEVGQMINEHHQSTGYAIALLRQVINVLRDENRNYIPHFIRERDQSVSRAQEHKRRLDELLSEIEHHETRSNWDMRKGAILRHDIDRYQETAPQYLQSVLLQQIYEAAIEVCERLAAYIGAAEQLEGEEVHAEGLIGEMYTLGSQLGNLKRSLMDKYEHFREKPMTSDLSFMLYEPEEIEKIYVPKYLGLGEKARGQIRELGDQILQELKTSVVNLPRLVREKGLDKVEHQIRDLARTPFRNIRRDYDVMEMLWKRYPNDAAREAAIRDVYKRAKFWLSGGHRPNTDKLTSERVRILVGLPQDSADTSKLAEFKTTLETKVREAGDPTPSFNNLADRSEIVFYTEVGGIPINWADSVPTLQQRYVQKQSEGEELHTDSNEVKFADLIVLDERQRQEMEDAHECFLLGLIFGKIKPERDIAGRIRYIWSETVGLTSVSRDFSLGIEMRALAELVAKPATRKKITQQIEETRDRVYVNRDLLARFNALLSW
ncbi:MAG: tubulin-like doman-containing protein, partial [Blastocatellia bacterium]